MALVLKNYVSSAFRTESPILCSSMNTRLVESPPIRRKLESEDSSYDSDGDTGKSVHDKLSRSISETLDLEFDEYVTLDEESYNANVEFALRLGYPEVLLRKALSRLGSSPPQNQILEELIRLQRAIETESDSSVESNDLSPIIIDGSNVAMSHGNKEIFSCKGILIAVNWFKERGHKDITVFIPRWRKESSKPETPIKDQFILTELEKERILIYTPSRQVAGKRVVCHDDRYILNLAAENDGIVVSNDNYRELLSEKSSYKKIVFEKILMYSFVNDRFMPPDDPLGRNGPHLDSFLRKKRICGNQGSKMTSSYLPSCPYGKKCTYGNKCKYSHPERGNFPQISISETLKASSSRRHKVNSRDSSPSDKLIRTVSCPQYSQGSKPLLCRSGSNIPRLWPPSSESEHGWNNQLNMIMASPGAIDTSVPPPPRGPWNKPGPSPWRGDSSKIHRPLDRQYSLNPNYDARISSGPTYPFPPPPHFSRQNVTRISSAPEPLFHFPSTSPFVVEQRAESWSHGPVGSKSRSVLYGHLSALFDPERVKDAMIACPDETDGQKLIKYMMNHET